MATIRCAVCNQENAESARFCNGCGKPLTAACNLCGTHNPIGATFCQSCGTKLASTRSGLTLQQVTAWRSAFNQLGWVQWRQFGRDDWDLVSAGAFPRDVDDSEEPWAFACRTDGRDYKPAYLAVRENDRKRIFYAAGNWMEKNKGIVVATRCRIAVFGTKSRQAFSWLYSDIKEFASAYAQPGLLTLVLWHAQGQLMQIDFQVPEQGVLDRLVIATATDTPIGAQATAGTAERTAMRADNKVVFKEAVEQYMRSAGVARKQVSDAARR